MKDQKRKVRSDKKHDIKPFVNLELKDSIYRLSHITSEPVKDVCEILILNSLYGNRTIVENLSQYFKRNIYLRNSYYNGDLSNEDLYSVSEGEKDRISLRVKREEYENISALAYALDCSISKATAALLYESITDTKFIEEHLEKFVDTLDKSRKKELKQLLKYINGETNEQYTLTDLLALLIDEPLEWLFPKK